MKLSMQDATVAIGTNIGKPIKPVNRQTLIGSYSPAGYIDGMTGIGERILALRTKRGMSQSALAKKAKVSQPVIAELESGLQQSSKKLPEIAAALGVSAHDLDPRYGRASVESAVDGDLGLRPPHETVAEIDVRAGAGGGGVPVETWVQDGAGNTYAAEGIRAHWEIPGEVMRELLRATPRHIRAFEVIGDSMEPRLGEGDRVFIDLRYTVPSPEGIFALWDGFGVVVKRLQIVRGSDPLRVRVISANPSYEPYEAAVDDIKIIGRYAGRFTTN